jgi:hypothetical protein
MGAGTITAPVMIIFLNMEPAIAIGTALIFSFFVKIPIGISYMSQKLVDYSLLARMTAGGVPGVIAGSFLLQKAAGDARLKAIVLIAVGVIVLISAVVNLIMIVRKKDISRHHENLKKWIPVFTFLIGLEVGFSSAGAGAMGTILILYVTGLLPRQVVATDIVFGLLLSAAGGGIHLSMGHVDFHILILLAAGGIAGAAAGIWGSSRISPKSLKTVLLVWLLIISSQLIYRGLGVLKAASA